MALHTRMEICSNQHCRHKAKYSQQSSHCKPKVPNKRRESRRPCKRRRREQSTQSKRVELLHSWKRLVLRILVWQQRKPSGKRGPTVGIQLFIVVLPNLTGCIIFINLTIRKLTDLSLKFKEIFYWLLTIKHMTFSHLITCFLW